MTINNEKMNRAELVLKKVKELIESNGPKGDQEVYLGAYQNGREQGYSLTAYNDKGIGTLFICWSEHRNSDSLVVYQGDRNPMQSLTSEMYEAGKHFGGDLKAAMYIANEILRFVTQ
jgi:hypothetical protein